VDGLQLNRSLEEMLRYPIHQHNAVQSDDAKNINSVLSSFYMFAVSYIALKGHLARALKGLYTLHRVRKTYSLGHRWAFHIVSKLTK
jgi:predicted transcriptional regulator of viral defense system